MIETVNKLRLLCNLELARAEAVLKDAEGKRKHKPTVDLHQGMAIALRKVLVALDSVPAARYNEGDLLSWYVAARSDGWSCQSPTDTSDSWEQAILRKGENVASIDIPGGTLVVYRKDRTEVDEPVPYNHADFHSRRRRKQSRDIQG